MARPSGGVLALLSSLLLLLGVRFLRSTAVEKERRGVKMLYFANSGCTGRLAASLAVIGSSGGLFFRLKFRTTTAAAKVRLRARVVSPFEAFLVDVKPAASGNELHGLFTLGETSLSRLDEITVEAIVFTYDFDAENITRNVLLTNETYYYQLRSDDLPVGDARAPSIPALRWRLHDEELAAALRCSRTPDAPTWCIKMPDRLWNMYFTSWYIPPPANELALMQLEPRAPRARLGDDRHVCFFGDSQMRHLFNAFVIATSEYKALPVPGKEVIASNQHTYVQKRWAGFDLGDGRGNISCTDIVANMGQWPAGWPEGRPWSFHEYELGVRADVEEMGALSEQLGLQEKRLYWLSTNPHGYMDVNSRSMYGPEADEWRWDGVIDEYNRIARLTAEESGVVQFLDVSDIARPLADLPYDGAHYAGILADEMAWKLISILTRQKVS